VKKAGRGRRKTTRKNEVADEFASGSEALDSRDAPSISVHGQDDVLVYRAEPAAVVLPYVVHLFLHCWHENLYKRVLSLQSKLLSMQEQEPDSDNEAQGTHRATPSMSQRVAHAAQAAKDTVQDTLTSALEQGYERLPFNWPALLGLLLLTLLAGHGLSSLLRPHYKSDDIQYFNRSVDQANQRYKQLGDHITNTESKLRDTEHRYSIFAMVVCAHQWIWSFACQAGTPLRFHSFFQTW